MELAVGSTNPVKVTAVEETLERFRPTVVAVDVDSGVTAQPRSVAETVIGAETRARRALESTDARYGVGLEGGVARFDAVPGLYLIMWAAVTDGNHLSHGAGPSIRLPPVVENRLEDGEELGPVMDDLVGSKHTSENGGGVAENEGAVGVLTDGLTDRSTTLGEAVACAFGEFLVDM